MRKLQNAFPRRSLISNLLRSAEDSAARTLIESTLRMFGGNIKQASDYVGCTRRIFDYRMKRLGIKAKGFKERDDINK